MAVFKSLKNYNDRVIIALELAEETEGGFLPLSYLRRRNPRRHNNAHSSMAVQQTAGYMGKLIKSDLLLVTDDRKYILADKGKWVLMMHRDGWEFKNKHWVKGEKKIPESYGNLLFAHYQETGEFSVDCQKDE